MDKRTAKDTITRFQYEAKKARAQASALRRSITEMRGRPVSRRDPVKLLRLTFQLTEAVSLSRDRERAAKELRVYL